MPGTNAGTGEPLSFRCARCRKRSHRDRLYGIHAYPDGHDHGFANRVHLTGRSRPYKRIGQGIRTDSIAYEYTCRDCGYTGWSAHRDLMRYAIRADRRADVEV